MVSAAANPKSLLPSPPGGMGAGMAVSVGVHVALLAALAGVVQWRTQTQVVAAAELWASVPEVAAAPPVPAPATAPAPVPAAPPPPPPAAEAPKPPDIATEQAARQRAERERQERERQEREQKEREQKERQRKEREQRERTAAQEREQAAATERAREEQLRRMMQAAGPAGATGTAPTGTAARDAAPSASYIARLAGLIRSNTVFSGEVPGNPAAEVEVRTTAGGAILSRRLLKSSGHPAWDDAVLRAIDRTGKLPPDADGRVPGTLIISFRPKE